jgi:hypothetical protein
MTMCTVDLLSFPSVQIMFLNGDLQALLAESFFRLLNERVGSQTIYFEYRLLQLSECLALPVFHKGTGSIPVRSLCFQHVAFAPTKHCSPRHKTFLSQFSFPETFLCFNVFLFQLTRLLPSQLFICSNSFTTAYRYFSFFVTIIIISVKRCFIFYTLLFSQCV